MIEKPKYNKDEIKTGIVHFGIGRFHRAHQAAIYHNALQNGRDDLGVVGVSLRSRNVQKELSPRNYNYHLWVKDIEETVQDIHLLKDILVLQDDEEEIVELATNRNIKLVTLTITEKGYLLDSAIYPLLKEFLKARMQINEPLVIISCDNLSDNTKILKTRLFEFIKDIELKDWIEENCYFPNSMIDRIVPATTDEDRKNFSSKFAIEDNGVVTTESFFQWYIEDFQGPLKDFMLIDGVSWTRNIEDVEKMKLRLLNAAHSFLAYAGQLAGFTYVHEAIKDLNLRSKVEMIWQEARFTIAKSLDLDSYCESLVKRFENPYLNHKLFQIGHDGSQKIPVRIQATIQERKKSELASPALESAVNSWKEYCAKTPEQVLKEIDPNF